MVGTRRAQWRGDRRAVIGMSQKFTASLIQNGSRELLKDFNEDGEENFCVSCCNDSLCKPSPKHLKFSFLRGETNKDKCL